MSNIKIYQKNSIQLVIARYNEELDWLLAINNIDILIYSKGENNIEYVKTLLNKKNMNCIIINLNNIGREGHTYINHIINNYNNLYNHTIFAQGFPFDHSPMIYTKINSYKNNSNIKFEFTNDILECDYLGLPIRMCDNGAWFYMPIIEIYNKLFLNKIKIKTVNNIITGPIFEFGAGAQFIVSKERIQSRPIKFYKKILTLFINPIKIYDGKEYSNKDPIEGYIIERLWKYIMTDDDKHNISIKTQINQTLKRYRKINFWK